MVEHVKAVDGVCRGPGCQVPADRCDVDHLVPWPAGRTHVSNLDSLSRGCHNGKTARVWRVHRAPTTGSRGPRSPVGTYITYPKDWREPLRDRGSGSPIRGASPDPSPEDRPDEVPDSTPPDDPPPF